MIYNKKEKTLKLLGNTHVHYLRPGVAEKTGLDVNASNKTTAPLKTASKSQAKQTEIKTSKSNAKTSNNRDAQNSQTAPVENKPRIRRQYENATP